MRMRRAHHAHVQHVRKGDIGGEPAAARHQRPILETRHRTSDYAHVSVSTLASEAARSAARMRRGVAGNSSIDTPKGDSASLIALRTAAGRADRAALAQTLRLGDGGLRHRLEMMDFDRRNLARGGRQVVGEAWR